MIKIFNYLFINFINFSRITKRIIMVSFDILAILFSFSFSYFLFFKKIYLPQNEISSLILFLMPVIAILIFIRLGLYRAIIRFIEFEAIWQIFKAVSIFFLIWGLIIFLLNFQDFPRSVLFINFSILLIIITASRLFAKYYLSYFGIKKNVNQRNIFIYGAGRSGIQLVAPINYSHDMNLCGFLDDEKSKQGQYISKCKIYSLEDFPTLINNLNIDEIIISIKLSKSKFLKLYNLIENTDIKILRAPNITSLVEKGIEKVEYKKLQIEDLIGRDKVLPDKNLISKNITSKSVIITGSGGTIGSEIARISLKQLPKILILFELNEYALYKIFNELKINEQFNNIKIIPILANIEDYNALDIILKKYKVQTMFHAAAYKHVDIVEQNIFSSLKTNIFGTFNCAKLSLENNLENFVFVSSDKAVRPTNFMGASKRFAELIVQYFDYQSIKLKKEKINFSIVRFGNVIGSSGSVIPLFNKQIKSGGPITLTHPNISRYFMTVQEAAELVIQASSLSKIGGTFLLNMGEHVYIKDLALKMIRLYGLKYSDNPKNKNEISIIHIGLRPGEKMHEELLVEKNSLKTDHKMIFKAVEKEINYEHFFLDVKELEKSIEIYDYNCVKKILEKNVEGFNPTIKSNDLIF